MNNKVLCVDDDPNILAGYQRNLRKQFALDAAAGGQQGLAMLHQNGPYAVIVADMQMPIMDGIEFLRNARNLSPDTVRIMLTGNADQLTAVRAVNEGQVYQFLTKPCSSDDLGKAIERGIHKYRMIEAERELLDKTLNGAVHVLLEILSTLDPQSFGHSRTLREYMSGFAQSKKAPDAWAYETAAMLCPIGFVTIPTEVLRKARTNQSLSGQEKDMLVRVPRIGSELIAGIPRLEEIGQVILYQEKHFDGTGFPHDTISGEAIPFVARAIKIFYDLIRLEQAGLSRNKALDEMQRRVGIYDPVLFKSALAFLLNVQSPSGVPEITTVSKIMLRDLKPGVTLASDVKTRDGVLIIAAGATVTPLLLERLRNFAQVAGIIEPIMIHL